MGRSTRGCSSASSPVSSKDAVRHRGHCRAVLEGPALAVVGFFHDPGRQERLAHGDVVSCVSFEAVHGVHRGEHLCRQVLQHLGSGTLAAVLRSQPQVEQVGASAVMESSRATASDVVGCARSRIGAVPKLGHHGFGFGGTERHSPPKPNVGGVTPDPVSGARSEQIARSIGVASTRHRVPTGGAPVGIDTSGVHLTQCPRDVAGWHLQVDEHGLVAGVDAAVRRGRSRIWNTRRSAGWRVQ